jgi:hypothetical protein
MPAWLATNGRSILGAVIIEKSSAKASSLTEASNDSTFAPSPVSL